MGALLRRVLSFRKHSSPEKSEQTKQMNQPKGGVQTKPSSQDLRNGLLRALNGADDIVAFPNKLLYQFEDAKPYNLDYPIRPAAVTYPKTPEQISDIVKYAASADLKVQVRSGGHSYANYCIGGVDGAVVIDMKHFQQFHMDESTWIATIGAGTLLDDVTKRLDRAGHRAIAHGVCPQVGAGGHLTVGGFGPSSRMWGTALDHVIEAQVVLADGSIVRASEEENKDVFYAIKGAAASFGVVTQFTVRTHPAPGTAVRYSYTLEVGTFRSMAQSFKNWFGLVAKPDLSRKLYTQVTFCVIGMIVSGTFFGTQEEFDALNLESVFHTKPKIEVAELHDWLGLIAHWTEDVGLHLVGGARCAFYSKCLAYKPNELPSSATVDVLLDYFDKADKGTALWFLNFELQGGATNDVPANTTAYAHRDILMYSESFGIDIGRVTPTTRKFITGINDVITSATPKVVYGSYAGYVDPELPNGQEAYWGSNLPKLEQIKRQVDPRDVFYNPQSVRLAAS